MTITVDTWQGSSFVAKHLNTISVGQLQIILKYTTILLNRKINHSTWALLLSFLILRDNFLLFILYSNFFSASFCAFVPKHPSKANGLARICSKPIFQAIYKFRQRQSLLYRHCSQFLSCLSHTFTPLVTESLAYI